MRAVAAVAVLAFGAGATDAFAFVQLRGIFTANMTGNLVLVGIPTRQDYAGTLIGASTAFITYVVVGLIAFWLSRRRSRSLQIVLTATATQGAVVTIWIVSGTRLAIPTIITTTAVSAATMALQTVFTMRAESKLHASTTYITGTLTSLLKNLADGKRGGRAAAVAVVVAIPLGALLATGTSVTAPAITPLITFITLVIGGCLALLPDRRPA